jgi:hypothetical protein
MSKLCTSCEQKLAELRAEFDAYIQGSEQAFGDVVDEKKALEKRVEDLSRILLSRNKDLAFLYRKLAKMGQGSSEPPVHGDNHSHPI